MNDDSLLRDDSPLEWSSILAAGPESELFLQGQLSQDLSALPADGRWALLLMPDSVVLTSCYVTLSDDGYAIRVPHERGQQSLTRLRRFLLRTKCTLELVEGTTGPWATHGERVANGRPWTNEFARALTPHAFGTSFVDETISFTKGCFTGQELVGRLDARGSSVPWRLVRVRGATFARIEDVVRSRGPTGPQGFTSPLQEGDEVTGLAIAHRTLLGSSELADATDVSVELIS